jgi:hypothetical protein
MQLWTTEELEVLLAYESGLQSGERGGEAERNEG